MIKYHAHPKRRLSVTDHESTLSINESENLSSSSTSKKKVKQRNEDDNDSYLNEILADNDK